MIVLFDLDGTLIDSAPDIHAVSNRVLATERLGALDLATVRGFIGRGLPHLVDRLLDAHGIADPDRAARMVSVFAHQYETAVDLTQPYPGVPQALTTLRQDGHVLGICTNKPRAAAAAVPRHLRLLDLFSAVIGGDSCPARKPDPQPLHAAWRACGAGPAVFVGDSEIDAETAEAAGVPLILYAHGYRHAPPGAIAHAALMQDFAALPAVLATIKPAPPPGPAA